ncbi:MAG TPA: peptide-methionine (S)-S-oxide reductase MsrA [Steroidobacteraceae bacterium]|nr:peptide-methionine (S)-S-oxide reductase MsrA [Steroidobacteraceae bacterium]
MKSPRTRIQVSGWVLSATLLSWQLTACAAEAPVSIPPPVVDASSPGGSLQTAVLSGGCFWGVQGVYEHVRGVRKVIAGYSGGERSTARYDEVSMGNTGHAESVQITFDPAVVSYGELLHIFFSVVHDPTQLNHQGADIGPQYRSVIRYADDEQKRIALAYIAQLNQSGAFHKPIATTVDPLKGFYAAEAYHQDFLIHNPTNSYIAYNDLPKIDSLKRLFPDRYSDHPVMVANAR